MPRCLVHCSTGDSMRFCPRRTAKRSDEARRVALREKKSESSPLQGGTTTPRGHCWGRHLWPSTEGPRTVGARAKIVRRPSLLGRATSRSPQARTSCEAMRRPEPVTEDTRRPTKMALPERKRQWRSQAKNCEAKLLGRLHRRQRRSKQGNDDVRRWARGGRSSAVTHCVM